jgi:uncharacterized protein YdcH (DUF465 family)
MARKDPHFKKIFNEKNKLICELEETKNELFEKL